MAGNKAVEYRSSDRVAVEDISYPDSILREGPEVRY